MTTQMIHPAMPRVARSFRAIGLPVTIVSHADGFLQHTEILNGGLLISPYVSPADLLHEAGHLALIPRQFRALANGDVTEGAVASVMEHAAAEELDPDGPLMRALLQCGDQEATAWAWAAGQRLSLPPETIIEDHHYDGEGPGVRLSLKLGRHAGINGLAAARWCATSAEMAAVTGLPVYPQLARWLQPEIAPAPAPTDELQSVPADYTNGLRAG